MCLNNTHYWPPCDGDGNTSVTVWFHAQRASYVESVFLWWRRHGLTNVRHERWYLHARWVTTIRRVIVSRAWRIVTTRRVIMSFVTSAWQSHVQLDPFGAGSNDAVPTAADEDIRPVIDGCQDTPHHRMGQWGYKPGSNAGTVYIRTWTWSSLCPEMC